MIQEKYEEVANAFAMIKQQFALDEEIRGVVNYQAVIVRDIIRSHYPVGLIKKSFMDWDKRSNDIDFDYLISSFQHEYYPLKGKEYSNPFDDLESRFLSDEELMQNQHRLAGYN